MTSKLSINSSATVTPQRIRNNMDFVTEASTVAGKSNKSRTVVKTGPTKADDAYL